MKANCSPVMSCSGVMPGASEMSHWNTAYPNPDAALTADHPRHSAHGPVFTMGGVMPGGTSMPEWHTSYPTGEAQVEAIHAAERLIALEAKVHTLPGHRAHKALQK